MGKPLALVTLRVPCGHVMCEGRHFPGPLAPCLPGVTKFSSLESTRF